MERQDTYNMPDTYDDEEMSAKGSTGVCTSVFCLPRSDSVCSGLAFILRLWAFGFNCVAACLAILVVLGAGGSNPELPACMQHARPCYICSRKP